MFIHLLSSNSKRLKRQTLFDLPSYSKCSAAICQLTEAHTQLLEEPQQGQLCRCEMQRVSPSLASAKQRQAACNPLPTDQEKASTSLLGASPTLSLVVCRTRPPAQLLLCFLGPSNGFLALGCPGTARMLSGLSFPRTCCVFFLCPRFCKLISFCPLGIKSGRAPTLPARTSPELKSSLAPGCQLPQEQWAIFLFKANFLLKYNIFTENCTNQTITSGHPCN